MPENSLTAFILDAHLKSALAAIRSLGRRDIKVIAGSHRLTAMGLYSKYVKDKCIYTSPEKNPDKYFFDLLKYWRSRQQENFLVYYFSDSTFLPLFKRLEDIPSNVKLILAANDSVVTAFNKQATIILAQKLNIPTPKTYTVNFESELDNISKKIFYPAVVKSVSSFSEVQKRGVFGSADYVLTAGELKSKTLAMFRKFSVWPLIQERVVGQEYGVEGVCQQGELVAYNSHVRLRSLSPRGGASVVKKTISPPDDILDWSRSILRELKWQGPVMVEWKYDEVNKQFVLLEINGRWWGSLPLSIFAGCDYPWFYYQLVARGQADAKLQARIGITSRHWWGDVNNLLHVLFKSDPMRSYLYPSIGGAVKDFFSCSNCEADVFDREDIWPALVEPIDIINNKLK